MAHLAIQQVNILAHNYGDIIAQELVDRSNERDQHSNNIKIKSLLLLNGGIIPEQYNEQITQTLLKSPEPM
ncbi:MAG: hypothetical protein KUG79_18110 [Pseudomonadales bacterium]|nr:hypothetical protein [Pseudomonadales bacterium]